MGENEENNINDFNEKYKNINPHLQHMTEDTLYHIGLTSGKEDLKKMFGDVKVNLNVNYQSKSTCFWIKQNISMFDQHFDVFSMIISVCLYGRHAT